jgi:hypothetical protein
LDDWLGEDGEFGADQIAKLAMNARFGLIRFHNGIVVTFGIDFAGGFQDIGGTKLDAEVAPFAAIWNDKDLTARANRLMKIERRALGDCSAVHYWPFN